MSNANRIYKKANTKASLYNNEYIDFTKEPMFLGKGRNTQRFDVLKYEYFDKLNDEMQGFDWKHDEISLVKDIKDFRGPMKKAEKFVTTRTFQKLIFLDSLQGRGPFLTLGQITTLPELENAILTWTYFEGCVVPETEVCTPNGWKKIDEITTSDDVLCCDINGYGGFNKPKEIHKYKSNGHITKFEGKNVSQFVSDQHRMLLVDKNNQRKIIKCQDMNIHNDGKFAYGMVNALTATNNQSLKQTLTDHERFLIALQADGSIYREKIVDGKIKHKFKNGNYSGLIQTTFDFRKERKQNRFRELIKKLGYQYQEVSYIRTDGKPTIKFSVQVPKKLIISKYFNDWVNLNDISSSWCKEFINELKNWDGWDYNRSTIGWDTTEISNVDTVEIISTIAGYKCSRGIQEYTSKTHWKDLHRLTFNTTKNTSSKRSVTATKESYDGFVHCLSVPGDFFVIRHNGKISITGNCKHSRTYTEELRALYDKPDEIFDESWTIPELNVLTKSISDPFEIAYFNIINYIYKTQRNIEISQEETDDLYESVLMLAIEINTLEGIRFYSSFAAMWALTEGQRLLPGTAENLSFICLHPETEVLTSTGWKIVEELSETDLICQYDMITGKTSFDYPTRKIWREYDGIMHKITDTNSNVIQHITRDHEVVVQRVFKGKTSSITKLPVQDLNFGPSVYFPQGGELESDTKIKVTTLDRFRIMCQADGHINKRITGKYKGNISVRFSFEKERKIKLFEEYCNELGFVYREEKSSNSTRMFSVNIPLEYNITKDLDWINLNSNLEYIDEILMEFVKWDGSIATEESNDKFVIFTSEEHIHDKIVALITLSSYKLFNYKQVNKGKETYKLSHKIYFRKDQKIINTQKYNMEEYNYKGMIGCVTMPKGTIITKSVDDKICVTSNCRDENAHLALSQHIIKHLRKKESEGFVKYVEKLKSKIQDRYIQVYNEELVWIDYLFSEGSYLGMNANISKQYLTYITIQRMKGVGIHATKDMLGGNWVIHNPCPWITKYINMDTVEKLPQEEKVLNYITGGVDQNVDEVQEQEIAKNLLDGLFE